MLRCDHRFIDLFIYNHVSLLSTCVMSYSLTHRQFIPVLICQSFNLPFHLQIPIQLFVHLNISFIYFFLRFLTICPFVHLFLHWFIYLFFLISIKFGGNYTPTINDFNLCIRLIELAG